MIGENVIKETVKQIEKLLTTYTAEIDTAYSGQEDGALTVSLSAKLSPNADGIKIMTSISFVTSRIKDGSVVVVDENQGQLFVANKKG